MPIHGASSDAPMNVSSPLRTAEPHRVVFLLGDHMPQIQATRLVDFAAIADDWFPVSYSIGPYQETCVLLADRPNKHDQHWRWNWEDMPDDLAQYGERFRIVQIDGGTPHAGIRYLDLPSMATPVRKVVALGRDRWLVFLTAFVDYPPTVSEAQALGCVVDSTSAVLAEFTVGCPHFTQAHTDGRVWLGYEGSDERLFSRTWWLEDADLRCIKLDGSTLFSFNDDVVPVEATPKLLFVDGLNVVSDNEIWVSYESIDRSSEGFWIHLLARIVNEKVVNLWPWSIVGGKAPVAHTGFAAADKQLLTCGRSLEEYRIDPPRSSPNRDQDRLYLVSLDSPRSMELLPVDEHGEWIGRFRTEGRGSRLYLETEQSLFVVDASLLPQL
jgi:hypothetical protein